MCSAVGQRQAPSSLAEYSKTEGRSRCVNDVAALPPNLRNISFIPCHRFRVLGLVNRVQSREISVRKEAGGRGRWVAAVRPDTVTECASTKTVPRSYRSQAFHRRTGLQSLKTCCNGCH